MEIDGVFYAKAKQFGIDMTEVTFGFIINEWLGDKISTFCVAFSTD